MSAPQATKTQIATTVVDASRPWPGLNPFTEEQHQYFYGRDDEVDELFHCVKRDIVTLLYSKSGLGKSSLLQAGLFPRLRESGFLPVYIRLNYTGAAGSLESQMKSALQRALPTADLAEVASPAPDESLWEYLHRRGGNLIDRSGGVVCPVLVFDQFEEIFTLGTSSDTSRQLRAQFLICFADLVENSIPQELRDRLADNPKLASRYDFSATGCRFIISLREEYVTRLEGLRNIPSLAFASSRMHLQEMNGDQALLAVSQPNPDLVSDDVSRLIVRFVAGASGAGPEHTPGSEGRPLADLEVAPAILSLFCRELSIKRGNLPQITSDLVTGNAKTIIDDFYHRCVDDKPIAVQCLIEDELVTELGYRNNIDLEDARKELQRTGVPASVIDDLVNERLLHIEDYRGTARLELTHDVLLEPVKRSREKRLEIEAREKTEAQERAALEKAKLSQELSRAKLLKKLAAAAGLAALLLLAMAIFAFNQKSAADKSRAEALDNATKAQSAEKEARLNANAANTAKAEALDNATKAQSAEKEARQNAEAANLAEKKAETAMQTAQAAKKEAEHKSQALEDVSTFSLNNCDDLANTFRELAEKTSEDSESRATLLQLYEVVISAYCVKQAKELHKADPDNYKVTAWLGRINVLTAYSASQRKDTKTGHENCNAAIETADSFSKDARYKTRIVAARTYVTAGKYLLIELHDASAMPTAERGMVLVTNVRSERSEGGFDDWDWDNLSHIYRFRADMSEQNKDYESAVRLYTQSFDAENNAYRLKPDLSYLQFEMDRAADVAQDAGKLQKKTLAEEWQQKFQTIAYAHANEEQIFSDAVDVLLTDNQYSAARKLVDLRIDSLTRAPNSVATQRQRAVAYRYSARISEEMSDWPRAVDDSKEAVDILIAAKKTTSDPKEQKALASDLAESYGGLSWHETLARRPALALKDAQQGLQEDSTEVWIGVNEAHALLFTGQVAEAKRKYMALKDVVYQQRKLVGDIQGDFQKLCEMNYTSPAMADIAQDLGIKDPKLTSCLASASSPK